MKRNKKIGVMYRLIGAEQYGVTRQGTRITIPQDSRVTKIKDSFIDNIRLRNMFILHRSSVCNDDIEIDIDQSIIDRYFVIDKREFYDHNEDSESIPLRPFMCPICGFYTFDLDEYNLHQAQHLNLDSIELYNEYCALKYFVNFMRKVVNLNDTDEARKRYSEAKTKFEEFKKSHNVTEIKLKKRGD